MVIEVKSLAGFVVIVFPCGETSILHSLAHNLNILDNHSNVIKPANRMIAYFFLGLRCLFLIKGKLVIFCSNVDRLPQSLAVAPPPDVPAE
jgi:hypothetical protein